MSIHQMNADVEAWNCYAARINAKAITAGLVTAEEVARDRKQAQDALARLRGQLG